MEGTLVTQPRWNRPRERSGYSPGTTYTEARPVTVTSGNVKGYERTYVNKSTFGEASTSCGYRQGRAPREELVRSHVVRVKVCLTEPAEFVAVMVMT